MHQVTEIHLSSVYLQVSLEIKPTSKDWEFIVFNFRYGAQTGNPIDNCQLSDWPVRDMDKDRHLIPDKTFDVFERASYGQGCEIQPITDEKHQKKCEIKL